MWCIQDMISLINHFKKGVTVVTQCLFHNLVSGPEWLTPGGYTVDITNCVNSNHTGGLGHEARGDWLGFYSYIDNVCVAWSCINSHQFIPPRTKRQWTCSWKFFFKGILLKGPYPPCVSMAGRALLARYHRLNEIAFHRLKRLMSFDIFSVECLLMASYWW